MSGNRKKYLKSKTKKELVNFIEDYMRVYLDPLGTDADIRYWEREDECKEGIYCTHSGEKLL